MKEIKFRVGHSNADGFYKFAYFNVDNSSFLEVQTRGGYENTYVSSIEQFTGLQDSSGVDIYEGDHFGEPAYPVEFREGAFWYEGELLRDSVYLEVVGNIHES